jgi:hypothetical protein
MNQQKIMVKYTLLAAERLYRIKGIKVEFDECYDESYKDSGIYFGECLDSKEKTITYSSLVFKEDELALNVWDTIVHEVTHFQILGHSPEFYKEFNKNFELVDDLRKEFNKEVGWEEDFIFYDDGLYESEISDNAYCELFKIGDNDFNPNDVKSYSFLS